MGYISARSELLAAVGFFAALTFARRAIVASSRTAGVDGGGSAGLLAIASSSSAAALPLVVLAYDAWVLRDPGWPLARGAHLRARGARGRDRRGVVPDRHRQSRPFRPAALFDNLLTGGIVIWRYLGLLLLPLGQALVHQVHWVTTPFDPAALSAAPRSRQRRAFAIWKRRAQPLVAFGVVWFLGGARADDVASFLSATRWPNTGSISRPPACSSRRRRSPHDRWRPGVPARAVLAVLLVALAGRTYRRNVLWSDPMALWEESVRRSPDAWQAHWGYGELLREIGRCDRAAPEYEAVLRSESRARGAPARHWTAAASATSGRRRLRASATWRASPPHDAGSVLRAATMARKAVATCSRHHVSPLRDEAS